MTFEQLGLIDPILQALEDKGYSEPTDIQQKAIPAILQGKDVMGCAQTGTGKTAAFAIPIIQLIDEKEGREKGPATLRALILTPTRELAIQIDENIQAYASHTSVRHAVVFGGVKQGKQEAMLRRGVHLLVATPGRLLDFVNQGIISLNTVKLFVLDEADKMLDMGFINDMKRIIRLLPREKQALLFSATMPDNIVKLSSDLLKEPFRVTADRVSSAAETVEQAIYYTNRDHKRDLLLHILDERKIDQVLLFTRTKHGADRLCRQLQKSRIKAHAIHGNKSQNQRQYVLSQFKEGKVRVLVATDIAARGIDIQDLEYVINYDLPNIPEDYVHRIGRSGRAGADGYAISLCEPEENIFARDIERLLGQQIPTVNNHPFPQTEQPMTEAEKKEWNKEKQRRKQAFFENRKKDDNGRGAKRNSRSGVR